MASLYDVAERAGVSKTLVSRVINNRPGVGAENRRRILDAMEELQYVPNALARSLVLQKTKMVGVVLDTLCEPYYFDLIRGIESATGEGGYDVLFSSGRGGAASKERNVEFFSQGRVDGVIIYGSYLADAPLVERLAKRSFPFVIVESEIEIPGINTVRLDNALGGELAVDHLVAQGCRNIWHFTGNLDRTASLTRRDGYLRGMRKHGLPVTEGMVVESRFEEDYGYTQMKQLVRTSRNHLPDGLFFGADATAVGAMRALEEEGVPVPETIKVVGFDDDTYAAARAGMPSLTTLAQPLAEMGRAAVAMLLGTIENPGMQKLNRVFPPKLIVRASSTAGSIRQPAAT